MHKMECVLECASVFERSLITSCILMFKANLTYTKTPVCIFKYSELPSTLNLNTDFRTPSFSHFYWLYTVWVRLRLIVTGHMNDNNLNWLISICLVGHLSEITVPWKSPQLRQLWFYSISEPDIPFWCRGKCFVKKRRKIRFMNGEQWRGWVNFLS